MSRQESLSYSPATSQQSLTPYGLAPGGSFGSPLVDRHSTFSPGVISHQQLVQQQNMLFRGMRATPEYTAPGPSGSLLGYGGGYGGNGYSGNGYDGNGGNAHRYEDMGRIMRSPLLEEFRSNRHRSWELMVSLPSRSFVRRKLKDSRLTSRSNFAGFGRSYRRVQRRSTGIASHPTEARIGVVGGEATRLYRNPTESTSAFYRRFCELYVLLPSQLLSPSSRNSLRAPS